MPTRKGSATPKVTRKSPDKSRPLVGVAVDPSLRGRGPKKGEGGRPPNEWKRRMEALRDRWLQAAEAESVLDNPAHPAWMSAAKFVHEAVAGKPREKVEQSGQVTITVQRS